MPIEEVESQIRNNKEFESLEIEDKIKVGDQSIQLIKNKISNADPSEIVFWKDILIKAEKVFNSIIEKDPTSKNL